MADPSNYASVITSEALQKKFRDTFPAQVGQGLGGDLLASGVVVPTVDFSGVIAGNTALPTNLNQAISFGNASEFDVENTTSTILSGSGFFRLIGNFSTAEATVNNFGKISLVNGGVAKTIFNFNITENDGSTGNNYYPFDFIVFLASGDTVTAQTSADEFRITGISFQIADSVGNLVLPSGFSPQ